MPARQASTRTPVAARPAIFEKPAWWHPNGRYLDVRGLVLDPVNDAYVLLQHKQVSVKITLLEKNRKPPAFKIAWSIGFGPRVQGSVNLRGYELRQAFWAPLQDGEVLETPGSFHRDGDHLNIPCAGTGQDGDPNVSIPVTDRVKWAVSLLYAACGGE